MPHSVERVIGSIGIRRRNFSLMPVASFAADPFDERLEIGRIPLGAGLDVERRDQAVVDRVLVLVDGGAHLTQVRRSSASRCRWMLTFASGMTAEARISRIVVTTSSSTKVKPRELHFSVSNRRIVTAPSP